MLRQVRLEFVGTAGAVANFGAVLITGLNEIEVEGHAADLPESIEVDLSVLENIGDGIFVRDLISSDKITVLEGPR